MKAHISVRATSPLAHAAEEEHEEEHEQEEEEEEDLVAQLQVHVVGSATQDKKKKKKGVKNRAQLIRELPVFVIFTGLFCGKRPETAHRSLPFPCLVYCRDGERRFKPSTASLEMRRLKTSGFYQVNAIRTILVDEAFGDFNEKTFADIASFEEVRCWVKQCFTHQVASPHPTHSLCICMAGMGLGRERSCRVALPFG